MVKRIFAVASVSALAGLVCTGAAGGCSSGESGAKVQPGEAVKRSDEAGASTDGGEAREGGAVEHCLSTEPIDATQFPYTKAVRSPGACSTQESSTLLAYFTKATEDGDDVKVTPWAATVTASCAKCVFSDGTGDWTPIIVKDDRLEDVNRGGCIEILSGKEACGRAYQRVSKCRLEACTKKCTTQDGFTECVGDAASLFVDPGPCKAAYEELEKECGTNLGAYEEGCRGAGATFVGPIRVQCITGGEDAGGGTGG
jgi:hypothetical protein